jgi:hypothetical protein
VVFAREGSAAGKVWNQQSMEFMHNFIENKGTLADSCLEATILGRLMEFTMVALPRYFTNLKKSDFKSDENPTGPRGLYLLDNQRFFVGPQLPTELKRDAKIVEWEILYQNAESPYTLDYEILQTPSQTIVRIDMPGVFPDSKVDDSGYRSFSMNHRMAAHTFEYVWSQGERQLVKITGRKVITDGKHPGLDIMVFRSDAINETTSRITENKVRRGDVKLTIELKQDAEKVGPDSFANVHAEYKDNGVMVVTFDHPGELEEAPQEAELFIVDHLVT